MEVTMRAGDGVHFTSDGGNYLARAVFKLVDAQCRVTAQKVAGAAKETIQTAGSTQVAPSSGSGSNSGSDGGGTVQTTPPATAAPSPTVPVPETSLPPTTTSTATTLPSGP